MKRILLFGLVIMMGHGATAQPKYSTKDILDSLEILKEAGGFVMGIGAKPSPEETRYYSLTGLLFGLPVIELKKLMKDKNTLARAYGYSFLAQHYPDSIEPADLEIFKDTAKMLFYTHDGIKVPGITLGQMCQMMYKSVLEDKRRREKEKDVIEAVKKYIKENAKYPLSYEPLEFVNYFFSWDSDGDDTGFEIQHRYKLKQLDGKPVEMFQYFKLGPEFKVNVIETVHTNITSAWPPQTEEWLAIFGKNKPVK